MISHDWKIEFTAPFCQRQRCKRCGMRVTVTFDRGAFVDKGERKVERWNRNKHGGCKG